MCASLVARCFFSAKQPYCRAGLVDDGTISSFDTPVSCLILSLSFPKNYPRWRSEGPYFHTCRYHFPLRRCHFFLDATHVLAYTHIFRSTNMYPGGHPTKVMRVLTSPSGICCPSPGNAHVHVYSSDGRDRSCIFDWSFFQSI